MTDEQRLKCESEMENMKVALDRGLGILVEMTGERCVSPAIDKLETICLAKVMRHSYLFAPMTQIDPSLLVQVRIAIQGSFLAGVEWGKANRDLYTLPEDAACDDPSHDHYVPPEGN